MERMTPSAIPRHFLERAPGVDPCKTVDAIRARDPERPVAWVGLG
jgi:hypothetical protein